MFVKIPARDDVPETEIFVNYLTKSSATPRDTMLMLPGGPGGNHSVYDKLLDKLLEYVDIILVDPRGCGLSKPSELRYCDMDTCAVDIHAVVEHFKLKDFILFGGSYGSILALCYVLKYNDLKKLILLAGATSSAYLEKAKANLARIGTEEQVKLAEKLWEGEFKSQDEFKEYYTLMAPLYIKSLVAGAPKQPPTAKRYIPYNLELLNFGFRVFLRQFDFTDRLPSINCETLVLFGKDDWINDPSEGQIMADRIPRCKAVFFENCGHFIWEDQPEQFDKELANFLTIERR